MDNIIIEFEETLVNYDKTKAYSLFDDFIKQNNTTKFIDDVIIEVLNNIGDKWDKGILSLSQVYLSSKICEEIISKHVSTINTISKNDRKIGIVTLEDYHILGKRIVSSTLSSFGFNLVDYGHGISAEEMIDIVVKDKPEILLISVLMYPSALRVKTLRDELVKKGINIKILVGGAPFNFDQDLWTSVGADAMGKNASEAALILEKWMEAQL